MNRKIFIFVSFLFLLLGDIARAEEVMEVARTFDLKDFKIEYNGNKVKVFTAVPWYDGYLEEMPNPGQGSSSPSSNP